MEALHEERLRSSCMKTTPTGVGRPRKACSACKRHKVQCSGERPICKRCSRLQRLCSYQGSTYSRRASLKGQHETIRDMRNTASGVNVSLAQTSRPLAGAGLPVMERASTHGTFLGLPKVLLTRLINAYFDDMYNATLLLHKASFVASVEDQSARPDVVLSVCVMASIFDRNDGGRNALAEDGFVQEWAARSSAIALQGIGDFHPDSLVTFCNLALYWYSQGYWRKALFYKASALSLLQTIGLGTDVYHDNTLRTEVRRRRLWACYLMQCQNAESLHQFEDIINVQKLPLPWAEKDLEAGCSDQGPAYLNSSPVQSSIYAELIRVMTIWSKVALANRRLDMPMSERISFIDQTQEELDRYWESVSHTLKPIASDFAGLPSSGLAKVMLMNIAYHQTICSLHASIVPLFSGVPSDGNWSHARQYSAQIAFKHAVAASDLITALLKTKIRVSGYPGFLGYAAYCGIAIQMPFAWCLNQAVQHKARRNAQANFVVIQQVAKFWKVAAILLKQTRALYDGYKKAPIVLEDEPRMIHMDDLKGVHIKSEETSRSILAYNGALQAKGRGIGFPESDPEPEAAIGSTPAQDQVFDLAAGLQPPPDKSCNPEAASDQYNLSIVAEISQTSDPHGASFSIPDLLEHIDGNHSERDAGSTPGPTMTLDSHFWWDRAQYQDQEPFIINPFQGSGVDYQLLSEYSMDQTLFQGDQSEVLRFFALDENFGV